MLDLDLVGNEFICMSQIGDGTAKVEGVTFLVAQDRRRECRSGLRGPGFNAKQSRVLVFHVTY
jgi:hypothetical protein